MGMPAAKALAKLHRCSVCTVLSGLNIPRCPQWDEYQNFIMKCPCRDVISICGDIYVFAKLFDHEPVSNKRYKLACVSIEDSDQPMYSCSLIKVYNRCSMVTGSQGSNLFQTEN